IWRLSKILLSGYNTSRTSRSIILGGRARDSYSGRNNNMKLLMLGWELPPHNSGGLGVACYHMAKALAANGVDIDFILPYKAEHPDTSWMRVHASTDVVPVQRAESTLAYSRQIGELRMIQANYIRYVEELVRKSPPEVIHAHDWLTIEAGIRAKEITRAPLIIHVHATEFDRSASDS